MVPVSPVLPAAASAGSGRLRVRRAGARSLVEAAQATSPLRLLTPRNHGHGAWVYTSTYGGGLVDGDRIAVTVDVGPGATLYLSTQSSTKIYRSPSGTSSGLHATVAPGGLLVSVPDPVVPFAASRHRQEQEITLADGAGLVLVDAVTSGRRAAGERWAFEEYRSRIVVHAAGRRLVHDALALESADGDLAERFGRFDVLATLVIVGAPVEAAAALLASGIAARPRVRRADLLTAATPLAGGGCVVRVAGRSTEAVSSLIRGCLQFVPPLLGDDPWTRRH